MYGGFQGVRQLDPHNPERRQPLGVGFPASQQRGAHRAIRKIHSEPVLNQSEKCKYNLINIINLNEHNYFYQLFI